MLIVGTGPQFPVAINPPAGRDGAQSAVDAVREQGRRGDPSGRLQRRASARDEVPRQAAAETVAERRAVERETGAEGDARRAAAGRPSAAFLAQLIARNCSAAGG